MSNLRIIYLVKAALGGGFLLLLMLINALHAQENDIRQQLEQLRVQIQKNDASVDETISSFKAYFAQHSDAYNESQFLNVLAYRDLLRQNLQNGFEKVLQARAKALESGNRVELAESYRNEGSILDTVGEYGDALEALHESLKLYSELESEKVLSVYSAMSNVYVSLQDYDGMLKNAYRQLASARQFNDQLYEGLAHYRVGSAQLKQGKLLDASISFNLAEKIFDATDYPFIGILYSEFAELLVKQGQFDNALQKLSQAIEADNKIDFRYNEVPRLLILADIYLQRGELDTAIIELEKSLDDKAFNADTSQVLRILEKLVEFAELSGNSDSQLKYLKQYNTLYKQYFDDKQSRQIAFNNVRQAVFEKDQKIKLLEKENQLQVQQNLIEKQNSDYQLKLSIFIFLFLLVVSGFLIRTRRQKAQLDIYAQELKKATEAKSDFLARMSHEIRTPINAISGLTKLMQRRVQDEDDAVNLQQIDDASQTLLGVINDILDFSKIEAGKLDLEVTSFQLDKVVTQSIRMQSLKAHEKDIELIQHIARDVPLNLKGDGLRIQQILVNLLSNAVKFTDDGLVSLSVRKRASEQGMMLEFAVRDTGVGLTPDQIKGLFESFSQVDESISRKYGGTGLGLAICKQLTELMGGKIWVESKPGDGSTFYFTVALEEDTQCVVEKPSKKLSTLRVLIIDDVQLSRRAISEALSQADIVADVAEGGQQAIEKVRAAQQNKTPYDILILDWKMPDLDGLQVASILNQEYRDKRPKIIMLSAFDFSQIREQALTLGIRHFIEKPFSAHELIAKLQELAFNIKSVETPVAGQAKNAPDLSGKRLLLAEDNKINQKVALGFLKDTQAEVHVAENGQEAVDMVEKGPGYDCVLMDVQMPIMDGLTAAHTIHHDLNPALPIVAMTAHAMKKDIEKSAAAGMIAHITKPIDPEYLYQILAEVLFADSQALSRQIALENETDEDPETSVQLSKLIQMDQQRAMRELFIDQSYFDGMLADFVAMKSTIASIQPLIAERDFDALYKIVHDAVSTLTYIGAYDLAKLAKSLELMLSDINSKNETDCLSQLALFDDALRQLIDKVETQLNA